MHSNKQNASHRPFTKACIVCGFAQAVGQHKQACTHQLLLAQQMCLFMCINRHYTLAYEEQGPPHECIELLDLSSLCMRSLSSRSSVHALAQQPVQCACPEFACLPLVNVLAKQPAHRPYPVLMPACCSGRQQRVGRGRGPALLCDIPAAEIAAVEAFRRGSSDSFQAWEKWRLAVERIVRQCCHG